MDFRGSRRLNGQILIIHFELHFSITKLNFTVWNKNGKSTNNIS